MTEATKETGLNLAINKRISLYDLSKEGMLIEDALLESSGELTPELEERFDKMLAQGPAAVEAASAIVRELTVSAAAAKEEKDRQASRQKSFEENAKKLKSRIRFALDAVFNGKLKTPRFTLFTSKGRTSTSVAYLGLPENLSALQLEFPDLVASETVYSVNKDAVLKIWEEELPLLQAYNDEMSTWRAMVEMCGEDEELKARALEQEPVKYKSRIPAILSVEITTGERSLTIK